MNNKLIKRLLLFTIPATAFLAIAGCSESKFKVKGELKGAENELVILEKPDFYGNWIMIDSTRISAQGKFNFAMASPSAPEIYRISLEGNYIYFPVDSTETISITSLSNNLTDGFSIAGSRHAEAISEFETLFRNIPANTSPDSLASIKRDIFTRYMNNEPGSIVAYYILTKTKDGKFFFDPKDTQDAKYFAAVATGFKSNRPNDPHTALLEQTSLDALRRKNSEMGKRIEMEAQEISLIDVELPDENGNIIKLSDIAGKGKPTVVIFSPLSHPDAPLLHIELAKIFSRGNVSFYQISPDPDQYEWRDAAQNLPWITVYDPEGAYSQYAAKYNVSRMPVFFIYDAKGELTDRVDDIETLKKRI